MTPQKYDECITQKINIVASRLEKKGDRSDIPWMRRLYAISKPHDLAQCGCLQHWRNRQSRQCLPYPDPVPANISLVNIMASKIVPSKSPSDLTDEVFSIMTQFAHKDRFLLGLTCEMPFDTTMEQLMGLINGIFKYIGRWGRTSLIEKKFNASRSVIFMLSSERFAIWKSAFTCSTGECPHKAVSEYILNRRNKSHYDPRSYGEKGK